MIRKILRWVFIASWFIPIITIFIWVPYLLYGWEETKKIWNDTMAAVIHGEL